MDATGVILAGGRSRRMGRDKLPLEVGGIPLVLRVRGVLVSHCSEIVVVGGGEVEIPGARRVDDLRPGLEGPLAGIEAGLAAARNPLVFVVAGDMPFVPPGLVGCLLDRLRTLRLAAVVPRYAGRVHPLCAAYHRGALRGVTSALDGGVRAVWRLLERLEGVEYVEGEELGIFGDPAVFLMNVNSPGDLAGARAVLGDGG